MGQVVVAVVADLPCLKVEADRGGGGFDSPVDAYGFACLLVWFGFDVDDEGRVPVSTFVPVDAYGLRPGWERA